MLVSDKLKCIFIHIQKTGGSSIRKILIEADPGAILRNKDLPNCPDLINRKHLFASELRNYLPKQTWDSYYKFAFIRNPWERLVSWYHMCVQNPTNEFMRYVVEIAPTFDDFIVKCTSGLARKTTFNQTDYISDDRGNIFVDFIGRYENLSKDFKQISKKLNLMRSELPHINPSKHKNYRKYYNKKTEAIVRERFAKDIKNFEYKF